MPGQDYVSILEGVERVYSCDLQVGAGQEEDDAAECESINDRG